MLTLLQHGVMLGVWLYTTLKFLLPAFLFLHLVGSYVYLGSSPLWDFIGVTARNILAPLNRVGMRIGRVDFAPLVGIILVLLVLARPAGLDREHPGGAASDPAAPVDAGQGTIHCAGRTVPFLACSSAASAPAARRGHFTVTVVPAPDFALNGQGPAMQLRQAPADRQSHRKVLKWQAIM